MTVNFNVPVTLSNYQKSDNPLFSLAKLKAFYVGTTGDKRLFTKEFSDKLLKTLPLVPVVAYYDEEKEDFVGHNGDVQYIYGLVPESANIEYIKEDGKEYAMCDVILYTGRYDKTGDIAQKIIGKKHSLELDPDTTKYKINRDADGDLINIEFTEGRFVGLSVLGEGEQPAFAGSSFFQSFDLDKIKEFVKEYEGHFAKIEKRGEVMLEENIVDAVEETIVEVEVKKDDTEFVEATETIEIKEIEIATETDSGLNFIKKTYLEKYEDLSKALCKEYGDNFLYLIQPFEDNVVIVLWSEEERDVCTYRVSYSMSGEEHVFGDKVPVIPRYLTKEEVEDWEKLELKANDPEFNEVKDEEVKIEIKQEQKLNEAEEIKAKDLEEVKQKNDEEEEEYAEKSREDFASAALSDSERKELEGYRREKKVAYVETFSDLIGETFIEEVKTKIDSYSLEELEVILSKEFTKISLAQNKHQSINRINPLYYTKETRNEGSELESLVKKYK